MKAVESSPQRLKVAVHGAVQGVGFRPYVYRLATELELAGWVQNSAQGVYLEVEGDHDRLTLFRQRLESSPPPRAVVRGLDFAYLKPVGQRGFQILQSDNRGERTTLILPDLATCADCLREIFDPAERRYRYPFTNCTNCGPRFSIIESLPYDRPLTAMARFAMCLECAREYRDPLDRRFDAQPIACPRCGPQLALWNPNGAVLATRDDALQQAVEALRHGEIVALKGLGGFQLLVDARDQEAVERLRHRKRREAKPFAVMFPSLAAVREACIVSAMEERLLRSVESPIVLLRKREGGETCAPRVAPETPSLGVLLPYTPLHHLLMAELGFPIVATSGNLSDEPICIDEHEALQRLHGIADVFLVHDRPIVRHVDDSIVRMAAGREMLLRRARGYAPMPVPIATPLPPILAVGAHLKNSVALSIGQNVFISQHIGDLATFAAHEAFRRAAQDLPRLYEAAPAAIACDQHPEYLSTKYAAEQPTRRVEVQHHWAHVLSCAAENELHPPYLGVAWDGTGYATDGTIWGGEFLCPGETVAEFERVAHLRPFRLPGGESAIRQPGRAALGLLQEMEGPNFIPRPELAPLRALSPTERALMTGMVMTGLHAPLTSSAGRLFDAVAALLDLRQRVSFEGEAAMALEFAAQRENAEPYPFQLKDERPRVLDWAPTIDALLRDLAAGKSRGLIAARFHQTLVEMILAVARAVGEKNVVLTGGCFQNVRLLEATISRLESERFHAYWHQQVPPNDGGISLGQVIAAAATLQNERSQPGREVALS